MSHVKSSECTSRCQRWGCHFSQPIQSKVFDEDKLSHQEIFWEICCMSGFPSWVQSLMLITSLLFFLYQFMRFHLNWILPQTLERVWFLDEMVRLELCLSECFWCFCFHPSNWTCYLRAIMRRGGSPWVPVGPRGSPWVPVRHALQNIQYSLWPLNSGASHRDRNCLSQWTKGGKRKFTKEERHSLDI